MTHLLALIIGLCIGLPVGATILRDWADKAPKQKPAPQPKPTVPLANVVQMSEWRRLDLPAVKRRQRVEVIDVVGE